MSYSTLVPFTRTNAPPGVDTGAVGAASIRLDRFASLQASFETGTVTTKELRVTGRTLHLNAKADAGEVTVRALSTGGDVLAVSSCVRGDSLDHEVRWQDGALPESGTPVRLQIGITNTELFAIWSE